MIYLMAAGALFGANPARTTDAETPALRIARVVSQKSEGRIVHKGDKQPWILLVDDDGSAGGGYPPIEGFWTAALDVNYAGEYDVYEVMTNGDGPPLSTLQNYDVVIWYTGETWSSTYWVTLSATDEANLGQYLDGGGALLLTGQDYFYDRYPSAGDFPTSSFPYVYLGLQSVQQDVIPPNGSAFAGDYDGQAGTCFDGLSGQFNAVGVYSSDVPCWLDDITPRPGEATLNLTADSAGIYICDVGFERSTGTYNVIYSNLGFEVITDVNSRAAIIKAAIDCLQIGVEESVGGKSTAVKVWPNPTSSKLNFALPSGTVGDIKLYDVSGRLVESVKGVNNASFNLNPGAYIYRVVVGEKAQTGTVAVR
ncbi:MAG: T9SS type A sorting domain-containing protein [candidate division WOR-3 bacterium]